MFRSVQLAFNRLGGSAKTLLGGVALGLVLPACDPDNGDADGCDNCAEDCATGVGAACPEDCTNGIDDNTDWLVDCDDAGCSATCDADGDGHRGLDFGGDDCDDTDPDVAPGFPETFYDDVDNDCDASTDDDDQDGDASPMPDDCNDEDARVYPDASEVCGDGVVNDCFSDGPPNRDTCYGVRSLGTADYIWDGSETDAYAGSAVALIDTDGDELAELFVGSYGVKDGVDTVGAVYRVNQPFVRSGGDLRSIGCELTGVKDDLFGTSVVALGPIDGELSRVGMGAPWLNVPENRSGALYVLESVCTPGPVGGSAFAISGASHDEYGTAFAPMGDIDGDGTYDIGLGVPKRRSDPEDAGKVVLFRGPIGGPATPDDAFATVEGQEPFASLGSAVAGIDDLDGDGIPDLAMGAPTADDNGTDAGQVYVNLDTLTGGNSVAADHLALGLGTPGDHFGASLAQDAGDLTGDGQADLVVGSPLSDVAGEDAGAVTLVETLSPVAVAAVLGGGADDDLFGTALLSLKDLDGDGQRDLVVGAPGADGGSTEAPLVDAGSVHVWFGPIGGSLSAAEADITLLGEGAYDFAGSALASGGDLDLDGNTDLIVTAPFHDGFFPSAGRVYLLTFGY